MVFGSYNSLTLNTLTKNPIDKVEFGVGYPYRKKGETMLKRIILATTALAVTVLIGCGGPPTEDINKATAAKKSADEVNAATFVKEQYDAASASMTAGEAAVKAKEWDKAKKAYMEAAAKFGEAAKAAPAAKDAMKAELTDRLAKAEENHAKMSKDKVMAAAMMKLDKDMKAKAENMKKECAAAIAAAKDALAKDDLMAAKDALDKDDSIHKDMTAMLSAKK